ncbi:MAG: hypothetical protein ACSW8J_09565 [bacterium]
MKRHIALIVALAMLVLGILPAYAAGGNLEVVERTTYVVSHSDNYRVYCYAAIRNAGTRPTSINDLLFEIKDATGATIDSTAKYKLYPEVLEAGQTGWLVISKDVKDLDSKSDIADFAMTITAKVNDDKACHALTATGEYLKEDEDENEDVLRASVTNTLNENAFAITVAMAARDAAGKLLYVTGDSAKDIGLASGSTLLNRSMIKKDIMDELDDDGIAVASVEALAYTVEDLD